MGNYSWLKIYICRTKWQNFKDKIHMEEKKKKFLKAIITLNKKKKKKKKKILNFFLI